MNKMEANYVRETTKRESEHPWRMITIYNSYPNGAFYYPQDDFPELLNLSAHKDNKKEADELSLEFYELGPRPKREVALLVIEKLLNTCETPYGKRSSLEEWDRTAIQLPGDIGGVYRERFVDIITQRCEGNVLETMAGFNTYVNDSSNISGVTAMDYSKEMLMRYPSPERDRILFDLNRISSEGIRMDFFDNEEFQTITCCYGVNYLNEPVPVFKELERVLSPSGKFLVLSNTASGYRDIQTRPFNPEQTAKEMGLVGLTSSIELFQNLKGLCESGDYYLVTGIKD
jgi:hypothetical protein